MHSSSVFTRFAGYLRVSKEDRDSRSLIWQRHALTAWVTRNGGQLVSFYQDDGISGITLERPGLLEMLMDARRGLFDAIVVYRFDRFDRSRVNSLVLKAFVRHELGVAVLSTIEPSEETDGDEGLYMEGVRECASEYYLSNTSADIARSKRERTKSGLHNNQAPFGMKKDKSGVLIPDEETLPGLQLLFMEYSGGKYSDTQVANLLNEHGYRTSRGNPFSKDTVREILQNRVYIGEVRYVSRGHKIAEPGSGDFSEASFAGKHEPVIDRELFETCQRIREGRASHHSSPSQPAPYILRDLVYCERCVNQPVEGSAIRDWGKMRLNRGNNTIYYLNCRSSQFGVKCGQKGVRREALTEHFLQVLFALKVPEAWQRAFCERVKSSDDRHVLHRRLESITAMVGALGFNWQHGFIADKDEYIQKRHALYRAVVKTRLDDYDGAEVFMDYISRKWRACEDNVTAQNMLLREFIERVEVRDELIARIVFVDNLTANITN